MKLLTKYGRWLAMTILCCCWFIGVYNTIKHLPHGTALGLISAAGTAAYIILIGVILFSRRAQ